MPTYEYKCEACGAEFELRQLITEDPVRECPVCHGSVSRLVTGGSGFIVKGSTGGTSGRHEHACSMETTGKTCCGQEERCAKPPCGSGR